MKKQVMGHIGIAVLIIGLMTCFTMGMQILQREIHWIENMCRII